MTDMRENILSYIESCAAIQGRIDEITALIASSNGADSIKLNKRRYTLYCELWGMEESIRLMREYLSDDDDLAIPMAEIA
jgi:hypothetical protein